jgi:hypothetical protein
MKTDIDFSLKEFLVIIFSTIFTFLTPIYGIFTALIVVSICDHFAGVWKAKKKGGQLFFWWGMWTSLTKAVLYIFIVSAVYIIDFNALNEVLKALTNYFFNIKISMLMTKTVGIGLFLNELKSIDRNYKEVKQKSLFSGLFEVLKDGRKYVNETIKTKNGLVFILIFISISVSILSCRSGEYYYKKAIEKGVVIKSNIDTIKITTQKIDSIPIYLTKDSIKWEYIIKTIVKDSLIIRNKPDFSNTKRNLDYQIKVFELNAKSKKDSLNFLIKKQKGERRVKNKEVKERTKKRFWENPFILFGIVFSSFMAGYFISKFK